MKKMMVFMILISFYGQIFSSSSDQWANLVKNIGIQYKNLQQSFILNFTDIHDGREVLGSSDYKLDKDDQKICGFVTMYVDGSKSITCFSDDPKVYDEYFKSINSSKSPLVSDEFFKCMFGFTKDLNSKKRKRK